MKTENNSGVLFRNEKKSNERAPDYKGKCTVNGVELELAAWVREGKTGKFMSIKFSEPYNKQSGNAAANAQVAKVNNTANDGLPF